MKIVCLVLALQIIQILPVPITQPKDGASNRIIGGDDAYRYQFLSTASILYKTAEGTYFCAGTLVTAQWIITAGQCVQNAVSFDIHMGSLNRSGDGGWQFPSDHFILHPDFTASPLSNDLGLIKLVEAVASNYSSYIRPISRLPTEEIPVDYETIAVGWGTKSDSDSSFSSTLQWTYVFVLSNDECKATYGDQITDEKLCVRGANNEGTCSGDSGGALYWYPYWYTQVLVGVSSFISQNGCENSDPSGFTRIFPFVDWINATIADNKNI